jgi:hypothetical protein
LIGIISNPRLLYPKWAKIYLILQKVKLQI